MVKREIEKKERNFAKKVDFEAIIQVSRLVSDRRS